MDSRRRAINLLLLVAVVTFLSMLHLLRYNKGVDFAYLFGQLQVRKPMTTTAVVTVPPLASSTTSNRSSSSSPSSLDDLATLNCTHMPPPHNNFTGKPIWVPGYPGSGSEMLGALVTAATGLGGHDYYYHNACRNGPATCKTHWPTVDYRNSSSEPAQDKEHFADRYIVLVRNPRHALPSYFNWIWETNNGVQGHSKQAPKEDWIKWRDDSFAAEIDNWKSLFLLWQKQPFERAMYLPYEALTNMDSGPHLFGQVAAEMRNTGVTVAPNSDLACLWYSVVKGQTAERTQRARHTYVPAYTVQQQALFLEMLDSLRQTSLFQNNNDTELVEILEGYYEDIRTNITIEE